MESTTKAILIFNLGSSSLKFAVYSAEAIDDIALLAGKIENIGQAPQFFAKDTREGIAHGPRWQSIPKNISHGDLSLKVLDWLANYESSFRICAVGHRIVHGGQILNEPTIIDEKALRYIEALIPLAPLHQPKALEVIKAIYSKVPDLPQIGCFDTSFHRNLPKLARTFANPHKLTEDGIIRYGFHGLSYDYVASQLPEYLGAKASGRTIIAHLGNGASLCAIKDGKSVAKTMGFTALDGLIRFRPGAAIRLQIGSRLFVT